MSQFTAAHRKLVEQLIEPYLFGSAREVTGWRDAIRALLQSHDAEMVKMEHWKRGAGDTERLLQIGELRAENVRLAEALKMLYEETVDYIQLNHLGDPHHNRSMQLARAALSAPATQSEGK